MILCKQRGHLVQGVHVMSVFPSHIVDDADYYQNQPHNQLENGSISTNSVMS